MINPYIGHDSQLYGVEEHRLLGGRGDGMRLLEVRNGLGLEFTLSLDRCADISRLSFKGGNYGYFSPCGYVHPAYYDGVGNGFLKSFTAGFLTTCGLNAVGSPCTDAGEYLPLHGTISNTSAEFVRWEVEDDNIVIHAEINDEGIFSRKLRLHRTYLCSLKGNTITICDEVVNRGDSAYPVELLYHMNMGYPLLCEDSELYIPSTKVTPRNDWAAEGMDTWMQVEKPTPNFEEQCYFHSFEEKGLVSIYSPKLGTGLAISFDPKNLPYFTQWKMMGVRDYVMGLEPGNCHPDGRNKMRAEGKLTILQPGESVQYEVKLTMLESREAFEKGKEA